MIYFGVVYLASTLYLVLFVTEMKPNRLKSKKENAESFADDLSVFSTYRLIWSIFKISQMKYLIFILLTFRVSQLEIKDADYQ